MKKLEEVAAMARPDRYSIEHARYLTHVVDAATGLSNAAAKKMTSGSFHEAATMFREAAQIAEIAESPAGDILARRFKRYAKKAETQSAGDR